MWAILPSLKVTEPIQVKYLDGRRSDAIILGNEILPIYYSREIVKWTGMVNEIANICVAYIPKFCFGQDLTNLFGASYQFPALPPCSV